MEEEMVSMISNGRTNAIAEASDSNSTTSPLPATKPANRNVAFTKFKGVVPHQNGHWGAQIYANHQRIWLGTFKTEKEAAMAYDSAAIKLRSGDSHRNYPWSSITVEEPIFQNLHSTEVVLNMIKDGSYQSKFADFLKTHSHKTQLEIALNTTRVHTNEGLMCKQLFQKELTPSDVGKLNRLVIPKKYAIKYFPRISEDVGEGGREGGAAANDMQLVFYDRLMRTWKFRYCYWKSSQSFVFTRGWNRFVREKELKANDLIIFYMCESKEEAKQGWTFCMIDVNRENNGGAVEGAGEPVGLQLDMQLQSGQNGVYGNDEDEVEEEEVKEEAAQDAEGKGFRLFGVHIS